MMWRAFFLAIGVSTFIIGLQCTVLHSVRMGPEKAPPPAAATNAGFGAPAPAKPPKTREITVPEWAPWSFMAAGAVVILYSFTIPKRVAS